MWRAFLWLYGHQWFLNLHRVVSEDNGDVLASFWAGMSGQMVCRWSRLRVG